MPFFDPFSVCANFRIPAFGLPCSERNLKDQCEFFIMFEVSKAKQFLQLAFDEGKSASEYVIDAAALL